eukprot:3216822-Rhodomonas_salina.1
MYGGIREMYKEHHDLGILKTTGLDPEPCAIYNGDEVGFNPSGNWARSLKFAVSGPLLAVSVVRGLSLFLTLWDKSAHMIGTGEKAPFWASVLFHRKVPRTF